MMHVHGGCVGPPSSGPFWLVGCDLGPVSEADIDVGLPDIEEGGQHRIASAALVEYHFPKVEPVAPRTVDRVRTD